MVDVYCDASGYSNGTCAICLYLDNPVLAKSKRIILEVFYEDLPTKELEYLALVSALEIAEDGAAVYCDNMHVVDEVNLIMKPGVGNQEVHKRAREIINEKEKINVVWIPRDKNLAGIYLDKRLSNMNKDTRKVIRVARKKKKDRDWHRKVYGRSEK